MLKLQVIVGSTRPSRHAELVLRWLGPVVESHADFQVETLDLRQWPLPPGRTTVAGLIDAGRYATVVCEAQTSDSHG